MNACLERIQEEMAEEKLEKAIIVMLFQEFAVKEGDKYLERETVLGEVAICHQDCHSC